jgi:hypothetical protein
LAANKANAYFTSLGKLLNSPLFMASANYFYLHNPNVLLVLFGFPKSAIYKSLSTASFGNPFNPPFLYKSIIYYASYGDTLPPFLAKSSN